MSSEALFQRFAEMSPVTLSVAKWAIQREHAKAKREELSGYYLASIVSSD